MNPVAEFPTRPSDASVRLPLRRPLAGAIRRVINGATVHQSGLASVENVASVGKESKPYLAELGIKIFENHRKIKFFANAKEPVHRWSPYVQGFAAAFVRDMLDEYKEKGEAPKILDPFAGSGTVLVESKLHGFKAKGVELNPLLHFVAETKINSWGVPPQLLLDMLSVVAEAEKRKELSDSPDFLKSKAHFSPTVLRNLRKLKCGIDCIKTQACIKNQRAHALLRLAFASILINCSNLKRSPCLTHCDKKEVANDAPFTLFKEKVEKIAEDLKDLQHKNTRGIKKHCSVHLGNSITHNHADSYDLVITSPPYMNGMDYVINYKIEMGWLDFASTHKQLKSIKDSMVVCDNVSKNLVRDYAERKHPYCNEWIEKIKRKITKNIEMRGQDGRPYRRPDMPEIVHKYFDDMYKAMKRTSAAMNAGGRFVMVVGDSLIADVYVPTDLILAKMGNEMGLEIERIEKARDRRSGQVRNFKLRETIVNLRKS